MDESQALLRDSDEKTADRPMMGHSILRAGSYEVTRLGELGKAQTTDRQIG
jgi:hypothetical protein